jgi:hypothetical protein
MTQISKIDGRREGIRELTSEEIAVVAGGHLGGIAETIACKINRIFECIARIFCCGSPPPTGSDIALKHDITLLGRLDNGLGFYRFSYNGSDKAYVGVMAQEVQAVMPDAVVRGRDGYLRVFYDKLGVEFQTHDDWVASGATVPAGARVSH